MLLQRRAASFLPSFLPSFLARPPFCLFALLFDFFEGTYRFTPLLSKSQKVPIDFSPLFALLFLVFGVLLFDFQSLRAMAATLVRATRCRWSVLCGI